MNHEDQQHVEEIAWEANQVGYIDTRELCLILAENSEYDVNGLMRVMGVDTRFFPKQRGQTSYRKRVGEWYYIIQKMISWDFADMQGRRIPLYGSSNEGWREIGVDEGSRKNIQYAFFKLTDLEKWFTETLKIPFPDCLTLRDTDTQDQGEIDPNRWRFRFKGSVWEIDFEGRRYSIDDVEPVRYMLPLIKQPKTPFRYTVLCHIVSGEDITEGPTVTKNFKDEDSEEDESDFVDGLNYQGGRIEMEYTKERIDKMQNDSDRIYRKYSSDMDREKENWKHWKALVFDEYGLQIKERDGELMFKKPKYQSSIDLAESYRIAKNRVGQYKRRFLKQLKKKNHIKLYEHFKQYLEPTGGGIQYRVPEGELPWDWEVIE
jgi:hypothetical protein